jgi:hypothetical protein
MMGQKGASLETTRRIYLRMAKCQREDVARLKAKRDSGKTGPGVDILAESVDLIARQLSGESNPVGTLKTVWRQVCEAERLKAGV